MKRGGEECENGKPQEEENDEIAELMREFEDIAKAPSSLRPEREFDHRIRFGGRIETCECS